MNVTASNREVTLKKIVVTGALGQLGMALLEQSKYHKDFYYVFLSRKDFDITSRDNISSVFDTHQPDVVINTAAYTAVDAAEDDKDQAFLINETAVGYLAEECKKRDCALIHVSTDYVFDGNKSTAYVESDKPNPQTVYGASKLGGELLIEASNITKYAIIRTSWVYSVYGHNFVKTMLRLGQERNQLSVVNDQLGCPTWANDLADAILTVARGLKEDNSGVYHFSNKGSITWYDFAKAIFKNSQIDVLITPVTSDLFPTKAKRPENSVLDTYKIEKQFQVYIPEWGSSLQKMLKRL
ncbi:dTDP-4-dehydrorhamnose reductase [Dokdonia sp. Asnod1-B02]|uniref:dTDP-4-dehydrorhamnose reductase n=1 Tax=Dokdonia sp. Asnod1-B02 TaxID=3160573 RepID=UPI003865F102